MDLNQRKNTYELVVITKPEIAEDKENIKIANYVDVICEKCPHNKKGVCKKKEDSEEKTKGLDDSIINAASISLDNEYSYKELQGLIKNIHVRDYCRDCEWKRYCDN